MFVTFIEIFNFVPTVITHDWILSHRKRLIDFHILGFNEDLRTICETNKHHGWQGDIVDTN